MNQIELKTSPTLWVSYSIFLFSFSSILLFYLSDISDLTILLSATCLATLLIVSFLIFIYSTYHQKVILTDNEFMITGNPSSTLPYNEIEKIKVNMTGLRIYGKSPSSILMSFTSSNYKDAKNLLIQKIRGNQNVSFEGSNRLIRKYFIVEERT